MAHHTRTHGHGHRVKKEPIKLDPTREKLIMRPDARLPKFFPAPKAIQVTPIYDDDDDGAAAAFYPPHSSSYPNKSRSRPTSRLSSRPNSRPSSVYPRRSRSHTPGRRAVYTDSEYDYDDAGYGSESSWGGEPGRSRSASRSAYGYGYGDRGRRSYSSDSGRGRTRSRTRTGYASGTEHDYSGYDYSRSRPATMYSAYDGGYSPTQAYGYSPGSAYEDDGQTYQARSRPENALTPSGKPYSQTPQPHSVPLAASASGHSHGHGHNHSYSQGQGQTMMQIPQSASASAYALSLAQSQSGNNSHRRSRLPDAVTPSGKPYSQTPQPHSTPSAAGLGYTPSKSNSMLQPFIQVPGSVRSSHSHGGGGRGGFGGGAFGGYQPTLPPPSAHSVHSHGGGGHVPSHTRSHHHHRSSSSLSSTGRSSGGSSSSATSVHRFTIQSPSSIAPTHVSYVPSRTPSHAVPDFSLGGGGGRGGGASRPGSQYTYTAAGGGGGGVSRPVSTYSYAAGGRPPSKAPSRMSYAPPKAPGSIMSASSAPSVGGGNGRDKGFFDAIERYLKVLPTNPNFCWSNCSGRKKAVCIGINYVGQKDELNGCANDARNIRKFLISTYGFKSEDILLLLDDKDSRYEKGSLKPTKREMFNAMAWLVKGARIHDSLFFHYSGHGGQSTDASGKEKDGKDETIYPVDYNQDGDIIDDELYQALVKPLPAGCRLTAIFDSCHSGTVLDLPYLHSAHGRLRGMNHISKRAQKRGVAPGADVICFAACKDDETSADTFHGGVATGAMSYALVQTLQQNPHMTYEELLMHLRDTLIPKYHQKAQISGTHPVDLGRPFTL